MPRVARALTRLLVVLAALLGLSTGRAVAGSDPGGVWPLAPQPTLVRGFEPPSSVYGAGHRGVDLLGAPAEPVVAALPGRVAFAGQLAGRGVVVVDHGATRTTYEPVTPSVRSGEVVAAGARLGVLGSALSHCPPRACLHLGWIMNATGAYLDPMRLFGVTRVRLLPLGGSLPAPVVSMVRLALLAAASPWSGARMSLQIGPA